MRVFKSKVFNRFARKAGLADSALRKSILKAGRGLIDADLGGGVIKQRVARPVKGSLAALGPSSFFGQRTALFSSTALEKTNATTSETMSWPNSKTSRR